MNKKLTKLIDPHWNPARAATVGLLATLVYSVAMETDKYITSNHFNDVQFIEGIIEGKKQSTRGFILAWLIHLLNGVALAEVYAAVIKRFLPGPNWLRGTLFGEIFVTGVWSFMPLVDKYHPLIKSGEMPKLATWKSFWQNILRHLLFGITLGLLYKGIH
ncbi:MAG TPA: DUF6789 family protein [Ktedonobacteraceae bacterium]|jgi:hypothetical protein|nr:DUF6789 family protein [Ktedonobacteraceae bacterium]